MTCNWKSNFEDAKRHFTDWWHHRGLVLDFGYIKARQPIVAEARPDFSTDVFRQHTDPGWIAHSQRYLLSRQEFPGDTLPIAFPDYGYASLSLYLGGAEPIFQPQVVWYEPAMTEQAEELPLEFSPENKWFSLHQQIYRETKKAAAGDYLVGMPGIGSNIEILAAMQGRVPFLMNLIDKPDWVSEKLGEINKAYFQAYERLYDIVKLEDGSSVVSQYALWGPGKVALITADTTALISPAMFERFCVPQIREQCQWLDCSMVSITGDKCLGIVDHLLEIEELDALSWMTNPNSPPVEDPGWFGLYKRILGAGKSLQLYISDAEALIPLLTEIGGAGVYVRMFNLDHRQVDKILKATEQYF